MSTSANMDPLNGALAGSYTVERELGRGGMATVYAVRDVKHGRRVALKVLRADLAASLGADRFRREITLAASLQHPHIVAVYDSGETPSGVLWFTMPLIEGESLRDRLRRQRQLPIDEALRITREVALALDYAHRHGVIHRDIKPENILLVDGQPMIADFGIARPTTPGAPGETLTATGMSIGTPAYMSPEQAAGERDVDAGTDIYSLGVVLYEMLAGEPPYTGPTAQAVAAKMMAGDPPSIRRTRPAVPQAVEAVVRKALSPVPADRFSTAAVFANALDTAERAASAPMGGATAGATSSSPPAGRRIPTGAAVLGLGLLIGAGFLFAWRRHDSGTATAAGPVRVAVLPFDTQGDTANAYLADGIAGEIRGKLSALPGLRIIATTSSNQYRHTQKPADQIGRELGVRFLLTGTVEWERGANDTRRVRVSPELVEVREGAAPETRWQQSYDTTLADVFDVQAAVATRVADKLGVVLSPPAQTRLAARPTQSLAAYDAYLRSRAFYGQDPATERRALIAAQQAVALDSTFAAAWALVSIKQTWLYWLSTPTPAGAEEARLAADRAVALAPAASDGYFARGYYSYAIAHDMTAARAAYESAVRLDPSSSDAHRGLALVEAAEGQWAPALSNASLAATLDPRSAAAAADLGDYLLYLRRYPDARTEFGRGLTFAPADLRLIRDRAATFLEEGDLAGARAALRDVPPTLDRATLAVAVGTYTCYPFDSGDRALVLTLSPSVFDDDRGQWGRVLARCYWEAGDTMRARRYADSARVALDAQLRATPDDSFRHLYRGLALAYLGQRAAAVREGERGLALAEATGDEFVAIPFARTFLVEVYIAAGDHSHAIDQLDTLLANPSAVSPALLRIEPRYAPLKGDPRFEQMLVRPWKSPVE